MAGVPTIACLQCNALRAVNDWHERGDDLLVELEPCGHVTVRSARMEWSWVGRPRGQGVDVSEFSVGSRPKRRADRTRVA